MHSKRQEYERALSYYERSLAIRRDIGDLRGEITSLNNIGLLYRAREQYERAAELRDRLHELEPDVKPPGCTGVPGTSDASGAPA